MGSKPRVEVGQVWRHSNGERYLVGALDAGATYVVVNLFSLVDGNRFYPDAKNLLQVGHLIEDEGSGWSYDGHISEWSKV